MVVNKLAAILRVADALARTRGRKPPPARFERRGDEFVICFPETGKEQVRKAIEKLVKEFNIKVAIHNHGVEDKHFPTPQVSLQAVKGRDPRMGLCIDFGYTVQSGVDPVAAVREAGKRLFAIHLWDTKAADSKGEICPVGDGIVPVAAIFRQLMKINYPGTVDLEYEIDPDSPLEGMRKSLAYMRGVIAGLNA